MRKLIEICNNNLCKKYYKIMKNDEKFLGKPKLCSYYTLNFQKLIKIEKNLKNTIIFKIS